MVSNISYFAINDILNIDNDNVDENENDIVNGCSNVPEILYYDIHNIKRRHFVDIFIPALNLIGLLIKVEKISS